MSAMQITEVRGQDESEVKAKKIINERLSSSSLPDKVGNPPSYNSSKTKGLEAGNTNLTLSISPLSIN